MASPYDLQALLRKYDDAHSRHLRWSALAQDAYFYVIPQRDGFNEFFGYDDAGTNKTRKIYSSVPQTAAISRANRLIRMLMPSNQRWGTMELNGEAISKMPEVNLTQVDVENAVDALYKYIDSSNLAQQAQDAMVDECVGAGAMWIESPDDENEPLVFEAIPGFCVMPEYYRGSVVRDLWYKFSTSGSYILDSYSSAREDMHLSLKLAANPSETQWIKRGVVWDYDPEMARSRWRYIDILSYGESGDFVLNSYYKDYKKLIYFRDRTRPGEVSGRGPAIEYMPEIKRLNIISQNSDMADELRSFPPNEVDTSKITPDMLSNFAGSMVPIGTFGRAFEIPASPVVNEKIESLVERINNGFAVSPIGGLNQPVRTATEVSQRLDAAQENTTIDVSRLLKECSSAIFESSFAILLERGLLPKSLEFLKAKKALSFSYVNPLGDIDKNNNLLKLQRTIQFEQQYFGPQAFMAIHRIPNLVDFINDNSGLPSDLFKPGAEALKNIVDAVQQSGQNAQQSNAPQATTTAQPVNPLSPEGVTV